MKKDFLICLLALLNCNILNASLQSQKSVLSMIVRNEADRYLKRVLESAKEFIDEAVIIDDASIDDTMELCCKILKDIPFRIIHNKISKFSNEVTLRKQQWEETIKTDPDWILVLDADEVFEDSAKYCIRDLLKDDSTDSYRFRLYDFWDEEHYREDHYWKCHFFYNTFLFRYKKNCHYTWNETAQHCGRFPRNISDYSFKSSNLRIRHYGWSNPKDRLSKYKRYMALDPDAKFGWKEQYMSILDEHPNIVKWTS